MSFKTIKMWMASLLALALVACGGGGGSDAGTPILTNGSGTGTGGTTGTPTVVVALSSTTVSAANAATVTVTVRDAKGLPVSGKLVSLGMTKGTLATLSVASVATGSDGTAQASLSAQASGISGADEVLASVVLDTTTVSGSAAFTVVGSAPAISLTGSSTTLRASTGPITLSAVVKDATGKPVAGTPVAFAAGANRVALSAPSVLTDSSGLATVLATPVAANLTAAETIFASATVSGQSIQSALALQLVADQPLMTLNSSAPAVNATTPATLSVQLLDPAGLPATGVVVTVSSSFSLTSFNQTTAVTNGSGVATVVVSPKSTTSNGADQIVASATVGGVALTKSAVVQVSGSATSTSPVLQTALSATSLSSASPATVTAKLTDGNGAAVGGQVVTFTVVRGLAKTNIGTALTDSAGQAVVILTPVSSTAAGADEVTAAASYAGTSLKTSVGFQIQATNVTLTSFTSDIGQLGPYAQTTLTLALSGASVGSPVNVSVTSACVALGKASVSPTSFTTTTNVVTLQYKDNGCGALQSGDKLQAAIVGAAGTLGLDLPLTAPTAASLAFVSASPQVIFIKGSGFTESSTLTFEVRDAAGNILPNRQVLLKLLTESGGVTLQGGVRPTAGAPQQITQQSDAGGRVTVLVNAGTQPTPIRVSAALADNTSVATVSSNLSVAVGLPSQLNFSMSQLAANIEGFDIDNVSNSILVIASDRNGNPVPDGTSINFVTEGGQIESIIRTATNVGVASATARFASSNPRPEDGRVTVTAYALGEESFIDQNGNNIWDQGEPFQDLGNVFKDRNFNGAFDAAVDEYIPTNIANTQACLTPSLSDGHDPNRQPPASFTAPIVGSTADTNALLRFDASIPSVGGNTCDKTWSGAGKVYVRRALETVLSTSAGRLLWADTSGLPSSCAKITLQTGVLPSTTTVFAPMAGNTVVSMGSSRTLAFYIADNNTFVSGSPFTAGGALGRFNSMAAGTSISVSTPTNGLSVSLAGAGAVPSTRDPIVGAVTVDFGLLNSGVVIISATSPVSKLTTSYAITVSTAAKPGSACTP